MNKLLKYKKWLRIPITVLLILVLLPYMSSLSTENIVNYAPASLPLAAIAFVVIYALKAVTVIVPVSVLYIATGIVFPTGWNIIIAYLCIMVTLSVGYVLGKRLGTEKVSEILEKQKTIAKFLDNRKSNLTSLCFVSRISPLPIDLCSMFFGAFNMPFLRYILISLLGLSPIMVPLVFAGESILHPLSVEFIIPFSICLVITFVVFIVFTIIDKEKQKKSVKTLKNKGEDHMQYRVIAIEREYASGGNEIGEKLAEKLGIPCYGQEILEKAAEKLNLPPDSLLNAEENMTGSFLYSIAAFSNFASGRETDFLSLEQKLAFAEADIIKNLSYNPCVIVGRGTAALLKDKTNVLKVFIHADNSTRIDRAVDVYKIAPKQAESVLQRHDKRRATYFKVTTNTNWKDNNLYHLFLNSGKLGIDQAVNILYAAYCQNK